MKLGMPNCVQCGEHFVYVSMCYLGSEIWPGGDNTYDFGNIAYIGVA